MSINCSFTDSCDCLMNLPAQALCLSYQICFSQKLICAKFGMIVQFCTYEAKPNIHITPIEKLRLRIHM